MIILHLNFNAFLYCFGVEMQEIVVIHQGDVGNSSLFTRLFLPYHENFKIFNVFEFLYSLVFKSIPQIFSKVNLRHWGQSCILKEFLVLIMIFKEKMKKMKKYHSFKIMMNI